MNSEQKFFGIGLSRTGTTTLHSIFEQLSLRSIHFVDELIYNQDWDVLKKYDAFCDSPIPMIYKQCEKLYPESKFILTTRNKASWLSSMRWMFSEGKIIFNWDRPTHQYHKKFYGTSVFNKALLEKHWDDYHRGVFDHFSSKKERLLVIDIDKGFDPNEICSFLGKPAKSIILEKRNARRDASLKEKLKFYLFPDRGI